jgi:RNA polymerase sigma-70 factor, ECF subfamily
MSTTSQSLLHQLKQDCKDAAAWVRLKELYEPFLTRWLSRMDVPAGDMADVVQDVFVVVLNRLPGFDHNERVGAFRCWLRTILINCLREYKSKNRRSPQAVGGSDFNQQLAQLEDPDSELSRRWDKEHNMHVVQQLLEKVKAEFDPQVWEAFRLRVLEGKSTGEVARELVMPEGKVRKIKHLVLKRLREEASEFID